MISFFVHVDADVGVTVFIPFDPAVDIEVHQAQKAIGFLLVKHLHTHHVGGVIQKLDLISDEADRCFIKMSFQCNRTILCHTAACGLPKVVLQILGGYPQAFHVGGKAFNGFLAGGTMLPLVVDIVEPEIERLVEFGKGFAGKTYDKVAAHRSKKTLYFSTVM